MTKYCRVAVKFPKAHTLTYSYPESLCLKLGNLVNVPLGRRKSTGCIFEMELSETDLTEQELKYQIKDVQEVINEEIVISNKDRELYLWMSRYYHYPLGLLVFNCLPKFLKRPRAWKPLMGSGEEIPWTLSEDQKTAYQEIFDKMNIGFSRSYIHGITGSGKTLIYLNLMREVIKKKQSILFLLPEINLTPQFTETLQKYLGCPIYSYHSAVTPSDKDHLWKELSKSKEEQTPFVVVGVRSSVFLPFQNLGLIVVDEEHDQSFKQNDRCPYNGRDVATKKAQIFNTPIVFGSATPTVENYFHFKKVSEASNDSYLTLRKRIGGVLPDVEMIDERSEGRNYDFWPITDESKVEIEKALLKGEQVLVFVNRLGFAQYVQCRACGYQFTDPNTDLPLKYFKNKKKLISMHSDYEIPFPEACPECDNMTLLQKGFGTEKVQEVLQGIFPEKSIERFDRDDITTFSKLADRLNDFHSGKIDVLVGTQMLSKGHNFENVNLVVVLGSDSQLNFPDFRSMEKTYQLLTQVTGRAGRFSQKAKVLIQSLTPTNSVFKHICQHSFDEFYQEEIQHREITQFPPFGKLANVYFTGKTRNLVIQEILPIAEEINNFIKHNDLPVTVLGPTSAFLEKRVNQYSWYFSLSSKEVNALHQTISFFEKISGNLKSQVKIDVDPLQLF